jgi:hypothetical protein
LFAGEAARAALGVIKAAFEVGRPQGSVHEQAFAGGHLAEDVGRDEAQPGGGLVDALAAEAEVVGGAAL